MKTSTKILTIFTVLTTVASIFLGQYIFLGITPTGTGFVFNFSTLAYIAMGFSIVSTILGTILFFKFVKMQKLAGAIFLSVMPTTFVYAVFLVYVTAVKQMDGVTAQSVKATLNIATENTKNNSYIWAGVATLVYLFVFFCTLIFLCKPLSKVENVTRKLGDGRIKLEDYKIGGVKQFKEIEHSLNKINYKYRAQENKVKKNEINKQKLTKEFVAFVGKNGLFELECGNQFKKNATVLLCELKNTENIKKNLSLETNFNFLNSYMKTLFPIIKRFGGFIDRYTGEGFLAVFEKSQSAIECSSAILRAVDTKNKAQKLMPNIEAKIAINTSTVLFGIVDEEEKIPMIVSNEMERLSKIQENNTLFGTSILFSKTTLRSVPQNFSFDFRYVGESEGGAIYEGLMQYQSRKKAKLKKFKNKFESAVQLVNCKNFSTAKNEFAEIIKAIPTDKISFYYFNLCVENLKEAA